MEDLEKEAKDLTDLLVDEMSNIIYKEFAELAHLLLEELEGADTREKGKEAMVRLAEGAREREIDGRALVPIVSAFFAGVAHGVLVQKNREEPVTVKVNISNN